MITWTQTLTATSELTEDLWKKYEHIFNMSYEDFVASIKTEPDKAKDALAYIYASEHSDTNVYSAKAWTEFYIKEE